jgi:cyclic pyranopterin phosphate synthase
LACEKAAARRGGPHSKTRFAAMILKDKFGRQIRDLRISVTDHCNFSCVYCKPAHPKDYFPRRELLTWDEFLRLSRILVGLGIRKVRVTGGEPLLRPGVVDFISRLGQIEGLEDVAITTNGYFLPQMAAHLAAAGSPRVTVSLDSMDRAKFTRMTRTSRSLEKVMAGIGAALEAGLKPVKVNIVLVRGFNDDEIVDFARLARKHDIVLRFVEFMPLDADHSWKRELVVTAREIVAAITPVFPLVEVPRHLPSETALRYRFADGQGEIGVIAPVSIPFCGQCSRIRLTADGKLRACLFSMEEHDVRHLVRNGAADSDIERFFLNAVYHKESGHRINEPDFVQPGRAMVYIGG